MDSIKQSISGDNVDSFSNVENKAAIEIIKKGILNETKNVESAIESEKAIPFTNDEALALFFDLKLTKHKYKLLRNLLKKKNADILPSYEEVSNAKTNCYPPSTAIQITETGATIRLQGLLDHIAARLLKMKDVKPENVKHLKLISKYGGDSTFGINPYKQLFEDSENHDENLFLKSLVPLRLECLKDPS